MCVSVRLAPLPPLPFNCFLCQAALYSVKLQTTIYNASAYIANSTGALRLEVEKKIEKAEFFRGGTLGPTKSESTKILSILPVLNFWGGLNPRWPPNDMVKENFVRKNSTWSCNTSFQGFSNMRKPFMGLSLSYEFI